MIIGITGTNGAGKGTVVDFLVQQKNFNHFSVRDFLIEEIKRQGLPVDRTHMRQVANEMRKAHGPAYVVEQLLERAVQTSGDSIIESVRAIGEGEYLKAHSALLWAVDADRRARYERSLKRMSETDHVTFEQFCEYEDREMRGTEPWDMNVFGVMQLADHVFTNNGTPEELFQQVEEALKKAGVLLPQKNYIDKLAFIEVKDRKVLETRSRGKDKWYIPGGKREAGENDVQALMREVKEELLVDIIPETVQLYGTFEAQAHGKPEGTMVRMTCYTAQYEGVLTPSAEVEDLGWFAYSDRDKVSPVDQLIFDDLRAKNLID